MTLSPVQLFPSNAPLVSPITSTQMVSTFLFSQSASHCLIFILSYLIFPSGYPAAAIRLFCERMGVSKSDNNIDMSVLEDCVRDTLGERLHVGLPACLPTCLSIYLSIHLSLWACFSVRRLVDCSQQQHVS